MQRLWANQEELNFFWRGRLAADRSEGRNRAPLIEFTQTTAAVALNRLAVYIRRSYMASNEKMKGGIILTS